MNELFIDIDEYVTDGKLDFHKIWVEIDSARVKELLKRAIQHEFDTARHGQRKAKSLRLIVTAVPF